MPEPAFTPIDFRPALRALYAAPPAAQAWTDAADRGFICTHLIERSIAALAPRLSGRMIDVGCGRQPYRPYFAHLREIVACDHDGARGEVDFTCPADRIPVPDAGFDSILCTEVLEHVPDPGAVWREFARILKPGGQVLLTTPMYWPAHEEPFDFYRFPACGLRSLAEQAGFEVREHWPRGGSWAFLGQVGMHVIPHYLPLAWMRRAWNRAFLRLDRARLNPFLSLGWTILARKLPPGAGQ
jgi:SAM-dependent methyltransferase